MLGRVGHLQRHRLGSAYIAKGEYGARRLPVAIVNRCDGVFDWNLRAVTPHENAARRQWRNLALRDVHCRRVRDDLAARDIEEPENVGYRPARRLLPGPARHLVRDEIETGDVSSDVGTHDGVADAVERDFGAFPFDEQCIFQALVLDGVAQRSQQTARLDLSLNEVVLRAFLEGLGGKRLVVQAREHHQRHARCRRAGPA